jgi:hypothetical protein
MRSIRIAAVLTVLAALDVPASAGYVHLINREARERSYDGYVHFINRAAWESSVDGAVTTTDFSGVDIPTSPGYTYWSDSYTNNGVEFALPGQNILMVRPGYGEYKQRTIVWNDEYSMTVNLPGGVKGIGVDLFASPFLGKEVLCTAWFSNGKSATVFLPASGRGVTTFWGINAINGATITHFTSYATSFDQPGGAYPMAPTWDYSAPGIGAFSYTTLPAHFAALPIPEPSVLTLLFTGVMGLSVQAWRRHGDSLHRFGLWRAFRLASIGKRAFCLAIILLSTSPLLAGFTGPGVPALPTILGDYASTGAQLENGRVDVPKLIDSLQQVGATDYFHLVWRDWVVPGGWEDFSIMAPQFDAAGIRLWLYLTPPASYSPDPFRGDYVRWASECALIAAQYPNTVAGIVIDDMGFNTNVFTADYCKQMMDAAHTVAPHLSLLAVAYWYQAYQSNIIPHVRAGAIDGVIAPYIFPHINHTETDSLATQIADFREYLDYQTEAGGLTEQMPLIPMIYATKFSEAPDSPTPEYVETCLNISANALRDGLVNGMTTYQLPKDNPLFLDAVGRVYGTVPEPGTIIMLLSALLGIAVHRRRRKR